jgi:hypothetical protein
MFPEAEEGGDQIGILTARSFSYVAIPADG